MEIQNIECIHLGSGGDMGCSQAVELSILVCYDITSHEVYGIHLQELVLSIASRYTDLYAISDLIRLLNSSDISFLYSLRQLGPIGLHMMPHPTHPNTQSNPLKTSSNRNSFHRTSGFNPANFHTPSTFR